MEDTLCIIKPDAMEAGVGNKILIHIKEAGFEIVETKQLRLSQTDAERFYEVHKGKDFYEELVKFMISGDIIACHLRRENAIKYLREVVGATNSQNALPGTIRNKYGTSVCHNAVHASDSPENAKIEVKFFFK